MNYAVFMHKGGRPQLMFLLIRRAPFSTGSIRNVAIIAHVDHGKTTLVDCLLRQSGTLTAGDKTTRLLDSNALERERGITILSKCTAIDYQGHRINIVDTPGHADFGGEVERALSMVDGVILVVDATEGPMAQTKFVLSKALKKQLKPIVVFNKVDRPTSRCDEVDSELLDLFSSLGASDDQLDYPIIYASARDGWALPRPPAKGEAPAPDMSCLFTEIISRVPAPSATVNGPFSLLVNSIEKNQYLGRCYLGKVASGRIALGDRLKVLSSYTDARSLEPEQGKVTKIFIKRGLAEVELPEAQAGDIVLLAGVAGARPNDTICSPELEAALPVIDIDPPTVSMFFQVNTSPLSGSEGKALTSQGLNTRIQAECENNIAIRVKATANPDVFEVSGRGEMQMGILIETIRREGYELAVSPPRVVFRRDGAGELLEPFEEVVIDCNTEYIGTVIEKLSKRKAELLKMAEVDGKSRLIFKCPMRGLIGYSSEFRNDTHGTGVLNHSFSGYEAYCGDLETARKGCLISMADGQATAYAISDLESRGQLFITPGTKIYSGMIIGESARDLDMEVNPCRAKILTNMRTTQKEDFVRLTEPRLMSLEESIAYVADDEIIEITPKSIRLRKAELNSSLRKHKSKSAPGR